MTLPVVDYLRVVAKQTYWKVPFEWTQTVPPRDDALPEDWSWLKGRTSRIYCDTPSNNEPMIHLFESEGWTRLPAYERPIAF